jgi:ATP-binding cassette subfamily F protein uup
MLIRLNNAQLAFGTHVILDGLDFQVNANERVCLVGKNGMGKSTLMKIIARQMDLDGGELLYNNEIVVARLEQDPPEKAQMSVFEFVSSGLAHVGELIGKYHHVLHEMETNYTDQLMDKLSALQSQMDDNDAWTFESRITTVLEQLSLPADKQLSELSGGWLRKAALAKALVQQPDVLLLDEPTNHLDLNAIAWLEKVLLDFRGAIVFISHDRAFIRSMATRIIDLDRGHLSSWPGGYEEYLVAKEEALRVEQDQNALFDKRLAQEEVWVRQGVKARRTRNEGRVRALEQLRSERKARTEVVGKARMSLSSTSKSGKLVFEIDNISYAFETKQIVKNFTTQIIRGDRIALIGPNGCGKSTLLKMMLGQLTAQDGEIKTGTMLDVAYFDQHRAALDLDKTVQENVGDGRDDVEHNGRTRHVLGYLQDFLFAPERARTPVRALSGGEKNRLLLAKLFLKPNNLLILDEPTNDLDIETLELLESLVHQYDGTLLLVSHDREFIDNTVTSSWWFGANGNITEFVGGFEDSVSQGAKLFNPEVHEAEIAAEKKQESAASSPVVAPVVKATPKLSYKDQRELELLPDKMESLEAQITANEDAMSDASFFVKPTKETQPVIDKLAALNVELEQAMERWEYLATFE